MKRALFPFAAAFAALALLQGCSSPEGGSPAAASSPTFDEVISSRRSIRDYQAGTTISGAEVRTLISTAQDAPSWANTQTTRYYVALSEEKVAAVKELFGLGKRASEPRRPDRIPLDEVVKFY